jgi:hypothetical protein
VRPLAGVKVAGLPPHKSDPEAASVGPNDPVCGAIAIGLPALLSCVPAMAPLLLMTRNADTEGVNDFISEIPNRIDVESINMTKTFTEIPII